MEYSISTIDYIIMGIIGLGCVSFMVQDFRARMKAEKIKAKREELPIHWLNKRN